MTAETILATLSGTIGQTFHSDWTTIDQPTIDRFADATGDHQFIHVDPARAAATPFGGTIAHGLLVLSLLPRLIAEAPLPAVPGIRMAVNYGFDRVRFVSPVRSGSRIRGAFTPAAIAEKRPGQWQQVHDVVVEIAGAPSPALVARWIGQIFV